MYYTAIVIPVGSLILFSDHLHQSFLEYPQIIVINTDIKV